MQLNDLLRIGGIDLKTVLVLRHSPSEPKLRAVLPWLAAENATIFNAYQQSQQNPTVEAAFLRASHIASFIGHRSGKALFVGLFRRGASRPMGFDDYWRVPAYQEMKAFGMRGLTAESDPVLWFDLDLTDFYAEWIGRLTIDWPGGERSWWRWADRNAFLIESILEQSALAREMPPWNEIALSWEELRVLPSTWRAALSEWRGIYLIFDETDCKGYVGAAYGSDNIFGRWRSYAATGHGGNKDLVSRNPARLRFSILERVPPDMEIEDVIRLENSWKLRLHTRDFGMNRN